LSAGARRRPEVEGIICQAPIGIPGPRHVKSRRPVFIGRSLFQGRRSLGWHGMRGTISLPEPMRSPPGPDSLEAVRLRFDPFGRILAGSAEDCLALTGRARTWGFSAGEVGERSPYLCKLLVGGTGLPSHPDPLRVRQAAGCQEHVSACLADGGTFSSAPCLTDRPPSDALAFRNPAALQLWSFWGNSGGA
jgi:hypothetical protein